VVAWQLAWQAKGSAKFGSGGKKRTKVNTSTGGAEKQQKMMVIQACMETDGNPLRSYFLALLSLILGLIF